MTDDIKTQIADNAKQIGEIKDLVTKLLPKEEADKKEEAPKADDRIDQVKRDLTAEKEEKEREKEIAETAKFSLTIGDYLKENKDFLPAETERLYERIKTDNMSDGAKKQHLQRDLLKLTFEKAENFNALIPSHRAKIEEFMALKEDVKLQKSSQYWEILETFADKKRSEEKIERVNRINLGMANDTGDKQVNSLVDLSKKSALLFAKKNDFSPVIVKKR
jgi:mannose/fructose/N-acetylgalactosamine-specific phosphotransferase system component IIB